MLVNLIKLTTRVGDVQHANGSYRPIFAIEKGLPKIPYFAFETIFMYDVFVSNLKLLSILVCH